MDVTGESQDTADLSSYLNDNDAIDQVGRTSSVDRMTLSDDHVEMSSQMEPERESDGIQRNPRVIRLKKLTR